MTPSVLDLQNLTLSSGAQQVIPSTSPRLNSATDDFPVAGKTHCALIAAHANDVLKQQERDTKGRRYRTKNSVTLKVVVPICITKWNLTLKVESYVGSKNKMVFDSPKVLA
jgi:hypothetical protein